MSQTSTQNYVEIAGIKDGIIILKNGGYRLIFSVSAVNFSLKSEEEQNSLIFQYQSFLNSLHFPIEIVMRSKRLDLSPYLKKINDAKEKQNNDLLKLQTEDYIGFVKELIKIANIMKKTFYVVVPYDPINLKGASFLGKMFKKSGSSKVRVSDTEYKRYRDELMERANTVASGLGSMGLHSVQLKTEEIIQLFYRIYNPQIAPKEQFTDAQNLSSSVISKTDEKIEEKQSPEPPKNEEKVIDNTAIVEDRQKKETQIKERETLKEGEKQIAKTPPAATESSAAPK